jgi:hypothetical protein
MDVPRNSALLLTLLTVFVACTGYAGGRLHQWYRVGRERDEAYREGYDRATRSVFSLAARIIGPRRERAAIRASASVPTPSVSTKPAGRGRRPSPHIAMTVSGRGGSSGFPVPVPLSPSVSAGQPSSDRPLFDSPAAAPSFGASSSEAVSPSPEGDAAVTGRHLVPDELVQAATYRLPPDRVARAKVRGVIPGELAEDDTSQPLDETSPVSVPKPRSS